jgi:hypothetical protein
MVAGERRRPAVSRSGEVVIPAASSSPASAATPHGSGSGLTAQATVVARSVRVSGRVAKSSKDGRHGLRWCASLCSDATSRGASRCRSVRICGLRCPAAVVSGRLRFAAAGWASETTTLSWGPPSTIDSQMFGPGWKMAKRCNSVASRRGLGRVAGFLDARPTGVGAVLVPARAQGDMHRAGGVRSRCADRRRGSGDHVVKAVHPDAIEQGSHRARQRAVCSCLVLTSLMVWLASGSNAVASTWTSLPAPNPRGTTSGDFDSVSCETARACVAVGSSSRNTPLTERWNGQRWSIRPITKPNGGRSVTLNGVSCSSATACTAVGTDPSGIVAERWNGRRWLLQRTPRLSGASFLSVSCPAVKVCLAVGDSGVFDESTADSVPENFSLTMRWNGVWSLQPYSDETALTGVSCASTTACEAVGGTTTAGGSFPIADGWNGHTWTDQTNSNISGDNFDLQGVSCSSSRACLAVGSLDGDGTLRWNGSTWSQVPGLSPDELTAVSCASRSACMGVGSVAAWWNGHKWSILNEPKMAYAGLESVSCVSASRCIAVGSGPRRPLVLEYRR